MPLEGAALQAAVQELCDKDAIRRAIIDSARGWDRLERDVFVSAYHPDAVDDHGAFVGTAADFYDALAERPGVHAVHHHLGHSVIEIEGDEAVSETSCLVTTVSEGDDGPQSRVRIVRYLDRFARREGVWRIAHRFVHHDVELNFAGGVPSVPEHNLGRRGREDRAHALFGAIKAEAAQRNAR